MTRARLAIAALLLLATACSGEPSLWVGEGDSLAEVVSSASEGSVIRVAAGVHAGPIVIDRPIELVGEPGAVIEAPWDGPALLVESDGVVIRDLTVHGGEAGIHVVNAEAVVLDRVAVGGAQWHGILVDDSFVTVTDCLIWGLGADLAQGFEIRNADGRPASLVQGCTIEGPLFEGIVAHVSHVRFIDNVIIGSTARAMYITEMSDGRMEGNSVRNSQGAAYFCGDMSRCSVVDNTAEGIAESVQGNTSGAGHGVVVHGRSSAFVDGFSWDDLAGDSLMVMLESEIAGESLYP